MKKNIVRRMFHGRLVDMYQDEKEVWHVKVVKNDR